MLSKWFSSCGGVMKTHVPEKLVVVLLNPSCLFVIVVYSVKAVWVKAQPVLRFPVRT
jgi:hypothetical protein